MYIWLGHNIIISGIGSLVGKGLTYHLWMCLHYIGDYSTHSTGITVWLGLSISVVKGIIINLK